MLTINKDSTLNFYSLNYLYEIHTVEEKLELLQKKYNKTFKEFETEILNMKQEDFKMWEDYLEWKSYFKTHKDLVLKKKMIEKGDFKIS
ncbi:MAG: hypothetical protein DRI94_05930 [Bacteroidetes bacterium]|nr:MAG: hypothetical protein DRI94_05930 [Bacteroidota bacterium]